MVGRTSLTVAGRVKARASDCSIAVITYWLMVVDPEHGEYRRLIAPLVIHLDRPRRTRRSG
jgi:hypothetical protein